MAIEFKTANSFLSLKLSLISMLIVSIEFGAYALNVNSDIESSLDKQHRARAEPVCMPVLNAVK